MKYFIVTLIFNIITLQLFAVSPSTQEDIDIANNISKKAHNYYEKGRYTEAEAQFEKSMAIFELLIFEKAIEPEYPGAVAVLGHLAVITAILNKYSESELLYNRFLKINEKILGRDHPQIAKIMTELSHIYIEQDQFAKAILFLKKSIAILKKALGPEHPDIAYSLRILALNYSGLEVYKL